MNGLTTPNASNRRLIIIQIVTAIIAVTAVVISAILAVQEPILITPSLTPTPLAPSLLKYGFDKGTMGWSHQTFTDSQAVTNVRLSSEPVKFGTSSLELQVELVGQDPQKSQGEAFVDFSNNPPTGTTAPLNLEDKPIILWVFVPTNAVGDPLTPNFVQVFVKDTDYRSQYGDWFDITSSNAGHWSIISITPTAQASTDYKTDAGFDPTRIRILGLKVGAGKSYTSSFKGSIWIGGVDWP